MFPNLLTYAQDHSWLITGLIVGTTLYQYYPTFKSKTLLGANYVMDKYLDYKYRDFKSETIELKSYQIDKIELITNLIHDDETLDHNLNPVKHQSVCQIPIQPHNLRTDQYIIKPSCHVSDFIINDETLLIIHYSYGEDQYIFAIKYDPNTDVIFPLDSCDDIDSCLKLEYDQIKTGYLTSETHPDLLTQMFKYAGPKGNFHSDTLHTILPKNFIHSDTYKPLLSDDKYDDDYLYLKTSLGGDFQFSSSQPIVNLSLF